MGTIISMSIQPPSTDPWVPLIRRGAALKRDLLNVDLIGSYTGDAHVFDEAEWVYLQAVTYAEQVHPWTVDQIDALGPIEGANAMRWTFEGPTSIRAGEPQNCTMALELAYSQTTVPGSDWRTFRPGRYKLRSYRVRIVVTRPSLDFDFRVYRLATRATKLGKARKRVIEERFYSHA